MTGRLIVVSLVILSLFSCKSPSKLVVKGNYDKAIEKSVKKMLKGNDKEDDRVILDKAYNLANQRDLGQVNMLKAENNPKNWERIYQLYNALNRRQTEVSKVLPFTVDGRTVNYSQTNYTELIVEAKTKAAEYFYGYGKKQMQLNTKQGYREAYGSFQKANSYNGTAFSDIQGLIEECKIKGISHVLVVAANNSHIKFPDEFYNELLALDVSKLNSQWISYRISEGQNPNEFDYNVVIDIRKVIISPESNNTKEITRTKKVRDGFEYVLDERGNVMKDTLGNDIKVPKYKEINCKLTTREQFKEATVEGAVQFISLTDNRTLKEEAITHNTKFSHISGKAFGDMAALSPEDVKIVENDAASFPTDFELIHKCVPALKEASQNIINSNKSIIK